MREERGALSHENEISHLCPCIALLSQHQRSSSSSISIHPLQKEECADAVVITSI